MQNIVYEQQQQLYSVNEKQKRKINDFKKYLVQSGTMMHFVKFLLGLRNKQIADDYVPSSDPVAMFVEYFGKIQPDTTQQDKLKEKINMQKQENSKIRAQIEQIKSKIQQKKNEITRKAEQKKLKEQQQAKNPKKGKK